MRNKLVNAGDGEPIKDRVSHLYSARLSPEKVILETENLFEFHTNGSDIFSDVVSLRGSVNGTRIKLEGLENVFI